MTESRAPRWDRSATLALLALTTITLASLAWLVLPYFEISNDASLYILTAKSLLAGEGYSYLGQPFIVRPPGFSLLLAPLIAWKGVDFYALNLFVNLFGALGVVLLFVWARARVGTWVALALSIAVWFNPGFRHIANLVMSDVPSVALLFACLLVERWAKSRPSWRRDLVLGACIGLSAYVRSINVLLLPAIAASRIASRLFAPRGEQRNGSDSVGEPRGLAARMGERRDVAAPTGERRGVPAAGSERSWLEFARRELLPVVGAAVLVMLPWSVHSATARPPAPADQLTNYSYSTAMWHVDRGDPASPLRTTRQLVRFVPQRVEQLVTLFSDRMEIDRIHRNGGWALGSAFLLVALYMLWRERRTSDFFAVGACVTLLLFISFLDRHALPVYIIVFVTAVEAALLFLERVASRRTSRSFVILALVALAIADFRPRDGWQKIASAHLRYEQFAKEVREALPANARVASDVGWHYAVYLDRPVYSLKFATERAKSIAAAEDVIDRYGIDTVLLWSFINPELRLVPYFESKYPRTATLDGGGGYVFRVRP